MGKRGESGPRSGERAARVPQRHACVCMCKRHLQERLLLSIPTTKGQLLEVTVRFGDAAQARRHRRVEDAQIGRREGARPRWSGYHADCVVRVRILTKYGRCEDSLGDRHLANLEKSPRHILVSSFSVSAHFSVSLLMSGSLSSAAVTPRSNTKTPSQVERTLLSTKASETPKSIFLTVPIDRISIVLYML